MSIVKQPNPDELEQPEVKGVEGDHVPYDTKTKPLDPDKQKRIVRKIILEFEADTNSTKDWYDLLEKDIQMYEAEKPSKLESLQKEEWMSDKNLGLCPSVCDTYQSTLLATCWNPDTFNFKPTETNDVDTSENLEKFAKWMVAKNECNVYPEVDDHIHNRIVNGFSAFEVYWKVWHQWVDKRIPQYKDDGNGKQRVVGYTVKTEKVRFERGVMENIANVSDLYFPKHGKTLAEKDHVIRIVHMTAKDIIEKGDSGEFMNVTDAIKIKLKQNYYKQITAESKTKAEKLGINEWNAITSEDLEGYPCEVLRYYGELEINGRREEYRVHVLPEYDVMLSLKPVRELNRKGKRPIIGGPLIRRPGFVRGKGMPRLTKDVVAAFNGVWNQKSDFQYVENCPWFFYNPDEVHQKQVIDLKPGKGYPSSDPASIVFPNHQRSMAWANNDIAQLLELLERLTGAASYFLTSKSKNATATRDNIVNEKSENRFGLWVGRIQVDICEAVTMLLSLYQDWSPPELGERVLGENGKPLIKNFSVQSLYGEFDANMSPDIISGSKQHEREIAMWGLETLTMTPWFDPMINPKGSWNLVANAGKKMGYMDIEKFMPPEPAAQFAQAEIIKEKWGEIKQGEIPVIEAGDDIMTLFMGMSELKDTKYFDLDEEYKPNFDAFYFQLTIAFIKMMKEMERQRLINQTAMKMIGENEGLEGSGQGGQPPMGQPQMGQPGPQVNPDMGDQGAM